MRKISLLFVIPSLKIGGIEKSLINLLHELDYSKYQVTLFVFNASYLNNIRIPDPVRIIKGKGILRCMGMTSAEAKESSKIDFAIRSLGSVFCRLLGADFVYNVLFLFEKKLSGFDYAISYSNNITLRGTYFGTNKYVLQKTMARKKYAWLHVDYHAMNMDTRVNNREYKMFDGIVCVSNAVKQSFCECNPNLENRCMVIGNVVHIDKDIEPSKEVDVRKFNIITTGRLDDNKNQIACVKIARYLKEKGHIFHWYLVGDGPCAEKIKKAIEENDLLQNVELKGYMSRPYSLMKACDLFVSTSKSESYGLAIAESLELGVPVVVNYYPALEELLPDMCSSNICFDSHEMCIEIEKLISSADYYKKLKERTTDVSSTQIVMEKVREAFT